MANYMDYYFSFELQAESVFINHSRRESVDWDMRPVVGSRVLTGIISRSMRTFLRLLSIALIPFLAGEPASAQQALSETEQEIVRHVDANSHLALDLLERSVNINSGSLNFEGVREVGRLFDAVFSELGFESRWEPGEAFGRAGHLISTRAGNGPHILMIGHLDTVFEQDSSFQKYEALSDSTARGPGVTDMKGGNVIIVESIRALADAGVLDEMTVTVVLIGDEESSGRPLDTARQALRQAADAADYAIAFESGDDKPTTAVVARRGFTGWRLDVQAKPAHSSIIFKDEIGFGAIYEAARILNRFQEELVGEQYLTFSPGLILGGTSVDFDESESRGTAFGKTNVIAEHTVVTGDLRTISPEQREAAKEKMRAIVAQTLPHALANIEFADSYPPMAPTEGNYRLLEMLSKVSQDLGFGPMTAVDPGAAGAADISFTTGLVEMALDGLGMMGDGSHTVDETADLRWLPAQTKRAAVLMHRLTEIEGMD